jgi:membrane-associated HD superfamily phosphohydrolase
MTRADKPSDLSEAALALDHELRRFEDLAAQAAKVRLNTEKSLERATDALSRAAECQDRIKGQVQKLVQAVAAARQKQESDASALMARAEEIAGRRAQFARVLQRMGGLGQMAKEVQDLLREGTGKLDEVQQRMQKVADDAADIGRSAQEQDMEDLARQADVLRQQVLAAKNKVSLLAKTSRS